MERTAGRTPAVIDLVMEIRFTHSFLSRAMASLTLAALVSSCGGGDSTAPPGGGTPVLTTILLAAPAGTITIGTNEQLTASPKDQNGNPYNAAVTWSSSNSAVATVSPTGQVRGIAVGVASVAAASGAVSSSPLTIAVIAVGGTYPLSAEVDMPGYIFSPTFTDIARTGTVKFVFPSISHNVIFAAGVAGTPANIDILANTTVSRTFNTAGSYSYVCTVHPGMQGTITVH